MIGERWQVIDEGEVGRLEGEPLADDSGMENLMELARSHAGYQAGERLNCDRIAELSARIKELEAERNQLVAEKDRETSSQGQNRSTYASRVKALANLQAGWINPIYAAVLRGITIDQGSLWNPESLLAGDKMGKELVIADRYLAATTKSQPVIGLNYVYSNPHHQQIDNLSLISGQTVAGRGFNARLEETRRAHYTDRNLYLDLPVARDGIRAVLSRNLGYYYSADGEVLKRDEDGKFQITTNDYESSIPDRPKGVSIPMPTGDIYVADERVVMLHGNDESDIVETHGYGHDIGRAFDNHLCAVGAAAVRRALLDMHELSTEATNREHSELFKEVVLMAARGIGVVIKSSDFKKVPTVIPVG